nr:hypothetical protein [Tanacetum cinerariifolium]
ALSTALAAEAQENIAKVQENLVEEEIEKLVKGDEDEESYASEFFDSVLNDDLDDFGTRLEPESHKENPKNVDDDDDDGEIEKEKKDDIEIEKEKKYDVEIEKKERTDNGIEFVNRKLRAYYEEVEISHQTSVACTPQQNGVVDRRNRTLVEADSTMLIFSKAPLFLWAEVIAIACKDLGKLKPKSDIGIFVGYAPAKKAFRIYNKRTRLIIKNIHTLFDEYLNLSPCFDPQVPTFIAPEPAVSIDIPSSTIIDQDVPSTDRSPQDINYKIKPYYVISMLSFLYKEALTESCWIEAIQEELNEFKRLEV